MKTAQNNNKFVEKLIKNLDLGLTTNKAVHNAVCQDVLIAHKQSMKKQTTALQQSIYRIILRVPIRKLSTAAAVIIITVLGGMIYWPSLKNKLYFKHEPVERIYLYSTKDSIDTFSDEDRVDSNKDVADRDKEKEQTR